MIMRIGGSEVSSAPPLHLYLLPHSWVPVVLLTSMIPARTFERRSGLSTSLCQKPQGLALPEMVALARFDAESSRSEAVSVRTEGRVEVGSH